MMTHHQRVPFIVPGMTRSTMTLAGGDRSGYNSGMKTAISIPDPVFRAGERMARRLHVSRSRLYAMALADYISRQADEQITAALNASLARAPMREDPFVREAARRTLDRSEW
jgi:predicted transcriptional regulator